MSPASAFVQLEYFGYMKRDPDEAGDTIWLGKLNQFGGSFVRCGNGVGIHSHPSIERDSVSRDGGKRVQSTDLSGVQSTDVGRAFLKIPKQTSSKSVL
jgi:hypothetical protein